MIHKMKLSPSPFALIKRGKKDIEMRLNDEKRRQVCVQDQIEFTNVESGESFIAVVVARHEYPSFDGLYTAFNKTRLGYLEDEIAHPSDMAQYYSEEEMRACGVVGLEIRLL